MNSKIPIKTEGEIEIMRQGGAILKEVLDKMEEIVSPGISTYELDRIAEDIILSHKGALPAFKGYHGFPTTLCTSVNQEVVHGIPSKDCILRDGDIIGVDCGVLFKDFNTDACITFLVGDVAPDVIHFVKTVKSALKAAVKAASPGGHIGDISAAIQATIERQGYSSVIECTGHGVGRNLHEPPEILNAGYKNTGPVIVPGMVFAIEPIAIIGNKNVITAQDGWTILSADNTMSAHFEHTVLVTETGTEILV